MEQQVPKWAQGKSREYLKGLLLELRRSLEQQEQVQDSSDLIRMKKEIAWLEQTGV